jgi:hypothetical protein
MFGEHVCNPTDVWCAVMWLRTAGVRSLIERCTRYRSVDNLLQYNQESLYRLYR